MSRRALTCLLLALVVVAGAVTVMSRSSAPSPTARIKTSRPAVITHDPLPAEPAGRHPVFRHYQLPAGPANRRPTIRLPDGTRLAPPPTPPPVTEPSDHLTPPAGVSVPGAPGSVPAVISAMSAQTNIAVTSTGSGPVTAGSYAAHRLCVAGQPAVATTHSDQLWAQYLPFDASAVTYHQSLDAGRLVIVWAPTTVAGLASTTVTVNPATHLIDTVTVGHSTARFRYAGASC